MTAKQTILTIGHGHPDLIKGGAEIAAFQMHRAYCEHSDIEDAVFLARADLGYGARGRISFRRKGEYLWEQGLRDPFLMTAANKAELVGYFSEFLALIQPSIVHSHHYFQLGLEYLSAIKRVDPSIRVLLTLHEYMAICPNHGLMMNVDGDLCRSGRYDEHLRCSPDITREDLWLRKHRFDRYFDHVDHFVAPSEFLRQMYIEWGISADRITTVENGLPRTSVSVARKLAKGEKRNRFGFFGQINPVKGLDVVFEGLLMLPPEKRHSLVLEVHGANLNYQKAGFRERLSDLAKPLVEEGVVRWMGPYETGDLSSRMAEIDWVVIPSIWYENSPLVVQEALANGRPVIASDLGALKEKVPEGRAGIRLPASQPWAWAEAMSSLAVDTERWDSLQAALPKPVYIGDTASRCLALAGAREHLAL